jgi:uncharacterized MAPEG superfamily protein
MPHNTSRKAKFTRIILAYPVALIALAVAANLFLFSAATIDISLPDRSIVLALVASAILLLFNHTWLMTSTELTRLNYGMHATPEEWEASGHDRKDVPEKGFRELERRHNAHANATENTVHFTILALLAGIVSPDPAAAITWIIGFPLGRIGHTFAYLWGKDGIRGFFMSISLLSLYGLATLLAIGAIV